MNRLAAIRSAARRAQNRKASTKRHDRFRSEGTCINGDGQVIHKGGRCESCWKKKLDGERDADRKALAAALPDRVYRSIGKPLGKWHWPHQDGDTLSACGNYALAGELVGDPRTIVDAARCMATGCRRRWKAWEALHV